MLMLDKLIQAVIRKNGTCSSSDIQSCSVRVNANPLLSDCVVGRRLVSDLELGLQDQRADILAMLNDSARNPKYSDGGSRHVSASWLFNHLASLDDSISQKEQEMQQEQSSQPTTPASDPSTSMAS